MLFERNVTPPKLPFTLQPKTALLIAAVVAVIATALTSFFVVDQTEEAVVLRFGKFDRVGGPGLNFKLPLGIEKNYNVPTSVYQNMNFGFRTQQPGGSSGYTTVYSSQDFSAESNMLTGDLNIVDVEWSIQFRITDARAWLFNIEEREATIRDITRSVINQLVGDRAILEILVSERTAIEVQAQELMNEVFKSYNFGINITTVKLQNVAPPKGQVQDAFEDVNVAIQDMNRLINEGKQEYNKEIPRAQGEAQQIIQIARGYAAERENRAQGDVARFNAVLAEYQRNRAITRSRLYYEMVEDVFKNETGVNLIDKNLRNFIPLQNLGRGQGGTQ
ncbi:MAG: FtsH protease activity modulator HflK [Spirochaetia bacterium]|jgi:membrane protease subunit HflK|nr:FtsH protease activity modulator HflK [Spirochaetia bacterium]